MNSRVNTRRADLGLPQFDLPPAEPVFSPNPVAELAITNTGGRITLMLRVPSPPIQHTLVQGPAPVRTWAGSDRRLAPCVRWRLRLAGQACSVRNAESCYDRAIALLWQLAPPRIPIPPPAT